MSNERDKSWESNANLIVHRLDTIDNELREMNKRLSHLERSVWSLQAKAAVIGGISEQSVYYKVIKRQLGFISDDIKVDVPFLKESDKLKSKGVNNNKNIPNMNEYTKDGDKSKLMDMQNTLS